MADAIQLTQMRARPKSITMGGGKAPQGRKSLLIKSQIFLRLRDALAAGNSYESSCAMAGISRTTFYRWMDEAESAPEGHPLREFRDTVKKACAIAEHRNVMIIQKAAARHWQAAAWWLERARWKDWGCRRSVKAVNEAKHRRRADVSGLQSGKQGSPFGFKNFAKSNK